MLLRKAYSIVAFALVGFTADKALGRSANRPLRAALLVAAYSGAIEVVQFEHGSHEGIAWNVARRSLRRRRRLARRRRGPHQTLAS